MEHIPNDPGFAPDDLTKHNESSDGLYEHPRSEESGGSSIPFGDIQNERGLVRSNPSIAPRHAWSEQSVLDKWYRGDSVSVHDDSNFEQKHQDIDQGDHDQMEDDEDEEVDSLMMGGPNFFTQLAMATGQFVAENRNEFWFQIGVLFGCTFICTKTGVFTANQPAIEGGVRGSGPNAGKHVDVASGNNMDHVHGVLTVFANPSVRFGGRRHLMAKDMNAKLDPGEYRFFSTKLREQQSMMLNLYAAFTRARAQPYDLQITARSQFSPKYVSNILLIKCWLENKKTLYDPNWGRDAKVSYTFPRIVCTEMMDGLAKSKETVKVNIVFGLATGRLNRKMFLSITKKEGTTDVSVWSLEERFSYKIKAVPWAAAAKIEEKKPSKKGCLVM